MAHRNQKGLTMLGIERIANVESLKHSAGFRIPCPYCGSILDYRQTVEATIYKNDDPLHILVSCASCFDASARQTPLVRKLGTLVGGGIPEGCRLVILRMKGKEPIETSADIVPVK